MENNILSKFNLNQHQLKQFKLYYDFLIEENKKINLTNITEINEAYIKHFFDSLILSDYVDLEDVSFCDIGSGAGFPSIPLKILYPNMKLTIIEPTLKRVKFLNSVVEMLKLENVEVINGRAEDVICEKYREKYDVCSARAVAQLPILMELCIPYVKVGGYFAALKGSNFKEELEVSNKAIKVLNVEVKTCEYELPEDKGQRCIILLKKKKTCPNIYPRKYALIKKKPL